MDDVVSIVKKLGPAKLASLAAVTIGVILFFVFITTRLSTGEMRLLYADLSSADQNAIVRELEEMQVVYTFDEQTNELRVSHDEVGRVRMVLAERGLPQGGSIGYEIFDEQNDLTTTSFKQNINQVRALEGELTRTITTLESVDAARVHLVLPRRELFSRESQPASASIFLKLKRGASLGDEQVTAIQNMVAAAVPRLNPKRVSIVDQQGNMLASGQKNDDLTATTLNFERMRLNFEQRTAQRLEDIVGRVVGFGKVRVNVSADLNFDRTATNQEFFDPEGQVARSTQVLEENEQEFDGGNDDVTVENNLPGLPGEAGGEDTPTRNSNRVEEITNFEISRTVTNRVEEGGDVERLSVAVLVDGTYEKLEDGTIEYTPRSEDEVEQILSLVRSSVGYDETRGDTVEVVNLRFADAELYLSDVIDDTVFAGLSKDDLFRISETGILGLVALLIVLLVLRPLATKMLENEPQEGKDGSGLSPEDALALEAAGMGPGGSGERSLSGDLDDDEEMIGLDSVEGKVKASSVKKVYDLLDNNTSESVSVIRSWIYQET